MHNNHRGILTVLVSAALLAAAAVTATAWYYPRLPDPARANRRELIGWLVTRDLEHVSPTTRTVLARRLEEEFSGEVDWGATAAELTGPQRRRLYENVGRLVGPWLQDSARRYAELPTAERRGYLNGLIDTLQQWQGLEALAPGDSPGGSAPPGLVATARRQLDVMQEEGSEADRRQVREFVTALQTRWFFRELSERLEGAARSRPSER